MQSKNKVSPLGNSQSMNNVFTPTRNKKTNNKNGLITHFLIQSVASSKATTPNTNVKIKAEPRRVVFAANFKSNPGPHPPLTKIPKCFLETIDLTQEKD